MTPLEKLGFFTPVCFDPNTRTTAQYILEKIECYLYLGSKYAYIIPTESSHLNPVLIKDEGEQHVIVIALKILSYATLVIPAIPLAIKFIYRKMVKFEWRKDETTKTITPIIPDTNSDNNKIEKKNDTQEKIHVESSSEENNFKSTPLFRIIKKREHKRKNPSENKSIKDTPSQPLISKNDSFSVELDLEDKKENSNILVDIPIKPLPKLMDKLTKIENNIPRKISSISIKNTTNSSSDNSVKSLMDQFIDAWDDIKTCFKEPIRPFNGENFKKLLSEHIKKFAKPEIKNKEHFGYIEKFDLDPSENPQIFVRADLRGDLKSLIENLRSLQEQKLLDEQFKCSPGVHLVFLGNYCNGGKYGTEILKLLMRLREENEHQVHLLRGNHEDPKMHETYGYEDVNLRMIFNSPLLKQFYETMSLCTYFSVINDQGNREYVQCTHSLFELTMDPAPLLDKSETKAYLRVPRNRKLSERICQIAEGSSSLKTAAQRMQNLAKHLDRFKRQDTVYSWGEINKDSKSQIEDLKYSFCALDIKTYLDLSSEHHQVKMIFRGHQQHFEHLSYENRIIATTLPVGVDAGFNTGHQDRAYILQPDITVDKWQKRAILRKVMESRNTITDLEPLNSSAI